MDTFIEYFRLFFSVALVSNLVLAKFLGLCPFIGVTKKTSSAVGMGFAVIFVMALASVATFAIYKLVLMPLGLEKALNIVVFILVIASLVQFVEMVVQKVSPPLYRALGIYLPLITTNCAVLGVTQLNLAFRDGSFGAGLLKSAIQGVGGGLGFLLAMILMSGMRERLDTLPLPKAMKGVPIAFVTTACLALAFLGFTGMA